MSEIDYKKIHEELLCAEVAGDILIMQHFHKETRESIERFFDTLPKMEMDGAPLDDEKIASLLIVNFLRPAIKALVEKWTVFPEAEE